MTNGKRSGSATRHRRAGARFADGEATALTDVMRDVVSGYAATKGDLDQVESRVTAKIDWLRDQLTVRFGALLGAGLTLMFFALEFTPG